MKNFFIISKSNRETNKKYISLVKDYIESHGGSCVVGNNECLASTETDIVVPEDTECIISIGGDGTVVRVAHNISNSRVPLVGLNCGHLGYLCDMSVDNYRECLDILLSTNCRFEDRLMLEGGLKSAPQETFKALNDVVVNSTTAGTYVLNLSVSVNGIHLYSHNCDGLILATPTGSTAYNLSANGPIVSPHADCIVLTPINPHTLNSRSIILSAEDTIDIQVGVRNKNYEPEAGVIFDGVPKVILRGGDTLEIYKSSHTTRMVRLESINFIERIRARMQEI